ALDSHESSLGKEKRGSPSSESAVKTVRILLVASVPAFSWQPVWLQAPPTAPLPGTSSPLPQPPLEREPTGHLPCRRRPPSPSSAELHYSLARPHPHAQMSIACAVCPNRCTLGPPGVPARWPRGSPRDRLRAARSRVSGAALRTAGPSLPPREN